MNTSGLSECDVSHLTLSHNANPYENSELYTKSGKLRKVKETKKNVKNEKKGTKAGAGQSEEYEFNNYNEEEEG